MVSLTNYIYLQTNKETIIERPEQPGFKASYAKTANKHRVFPNLTPKNVHQNLSYAIIVYNFDIYKEI